MSTKKITQLTSLAQVDISSGNDVLPIVDLSAGETKKVTAVALIGAAVDNMTATWNNVAAVFNGIKLNVTDTASDATSRLISLQVGGVDKAYITKAGTLNIAGAAVISGVTTMTGAATAVSSLKSTSETGGVGYGAGAGGAATQSTSKSTAVTLNKICGEITMNNATLNRETAVSFTLTNSAIAATDVVVVNIKSGATANAYNVGVTAVAAGSCRIQLHNLLGGTDLSEAVVLNFAVIKAVAA
jgi:hypothetical protein